MLKRKCFPPNVFDQPISYKFYSTLTMLDFGCKFILQFWFQNVGSYIFSGALFLIRIYV